MTKSTSTSPRAELAEKLAASIREFHLTNPYGGDVSQDDRTKGKPYRVAFSSPAHLDGEIAVYSGKFIRFLFQSTSAGKQSIVVESEENALKLLTAIATRDWDTVHQIPRKTENTENRGSRGN